MSRSQRRKVSHTGAGALWARIKPRRYLAWAVVFSVHAIAWLVLTIPPTPIKRDALVPARMSSDVISVRLIKPVSAVTTPSPSAAGVPAVRHAQHKPIKHHHVAPAHIVPSSRPAKRRALSLALPSASAAGKHWSVGRTLHGRQHKPPRVPGHDRVHGAPVFAMADPRFHGIAGLTRVAQGLLGEVNPHCVDVDAWRAMSSDQLHQHHLTRFKVNHTAHKYRCGPPKVGVEHPDGAPVY